MRQHRTGSSIFVVLTDDNERHDDCLWDKGYGQVGSGDGGSCQGLETGRREKGKREEPMMSGICRVFMLACAFACGGSVIAADASAESDAARDAIAQINHLNWVVSKIKTYNDAIVLEEEYRQISPDKLNLNRIPDRDTLGKILEMLDLLHGMTNDEREMQEWKRSFEIRRKRQLFAFWRNQIGSAQSTVSGLGW